MSLKQTAIVPIGADPEFFLYDTELKMNISGHGIIPGTKEKPYKLKDGAVQLDGTAAEFNINPANSSEEFVHNIKSVIGEIREMVPKKIDFQFQPTVVYKEDYFTKIVPSSCKELGCDPDFDAWNDGSINPRPDNKTPMRTAGGHLHVGFVADNKADINSMEHRLDCIVLTRQIDTFFNPFIQFWDTDKRRRQMYGAPGAFRPKTYGVEYRSLSNAWLAKPKLWPWLFDSLQYVTEQALEGNHIQPHYPSFLSDSDEYFKSFNRHLKKAPPSLKEYLQDA